jgi:cell division protein ZapE
LPIDVITRYQTLIADGRIEADPAQRAVALKLHQLSERLSTHRLARKTSQLGWLFGKKHQDQPLKGLYIHGGVGRGKTMLMDLFFRCVPVQRKRRAHFHSFMLDVHERIHAIRNAPAGTYKDHDPIEIAAEALFDEAWLLCFDEFSVTDIADAMILGRLFAALWKKGAVIVATSNVEPVHLYKDGLNHALFLPFIALLQQQMDIMRLDARTDYRLEKLSGGDLYFTPNNASARAGLDAIWNRLTGGAPPLQRDLAVLSRQIVIPIAGWGVARFSFEQLCAQPFSAADYLAIARAYHTVLLDDLPVMTESKRNEAKRFITAVDIFYEAHVKFAISAEAPIDQIYSAASGTEAFEFQRTISRLIEMRSTEYLAKPHGSPDSKASGKTSGLVET